MLSKTIKIECDACAADLTETGAIPAYRLQLSPEAIASYSNVMCSVVVRPPIDRQHHFCGLDCLDLWRDRTRHRNKLRREWLDQWKSSHGTKRGGGRVISYPCPPEDVAAEREREIEANTLAAFPPATKRQKA